MWQIYLRGIVCTSASPTGTLKYYQDMARKAKIEPKLMGIAEKESRPHLIGLTTMRKIISAQPP